METLIAWIIFAIPACIILSNKNRGFGYYLLAIFFPLVGFIVALCLKKLNIEEEYKESPILDITADTAMCSSLHKSEDGFASANNTISQQICGSVPAKEELSRSEKESLIQCDSFCSHCGAKIEQNDRFCTHCGCKLQ